MTDTPHRLSRQIIDDDDDHQTVIGTYPDQGRATAAAMAARDRLKPGALSHRFIVHPIGQGALPFGDHEILVARTRPDPEKVRKKVASLVKSFDDKWAVLASLPRHMRPDACAELINAVVAEIMTHG